MFLSVVRKRANPACSAVAGNSPFLSCPIPAEKQCSPYALPKKAGSAPALPDRKETLMLRRESRRSVETARGEFNHRLDLLPVQFLKPFHDVVDTGPGSDILEDCRPGHTRSPQHPRAADRARDALHGGAF